MAWDMIGNDWAVALLRRQVATGKVAHAYLITGPPQIGKTRLALTLARALNCTRPEPPCGQCPACVKILTGTHPDVRLVIGEGAGGSIKIDQVRLLQREAVLFPYEGRQRVFILRRIDLASAEATNSLLKTLEEPPGHVVLVLTAVHAEALPATVVSRCQGLDLRPIARSTVETALLDAGLPAEKARLLAGLSAGRIGWALQAAGDEALLARRQRNLDQLLGLLAADRIERLDFAQRLGRDPAASRDLLELWASWWRDLLLLSGRGGQNLLNVERAAELSALARGNHLAQVLAVLKALQAAAAQIDDNVNPRLALEGLLLKLRRRAFEPEEDGSWH